MLAISLDGFEEAMWPRGFHMGGRRWAGHQRGGKQGRLLPGGDGQRLL